MSKFSGWGKQGDALLATFLIGVILLLIIPLSSFLLDAFLCLSIVLAVMTLLMTLYVENPLEFSSFPTLLLFLTLFRLSLTIASTRMILTRAEAGDIIHTFGDFVVQGNWIVGLILFALLTVINFTVVTKGAGRIAEVAARFALESLPGKQMAIENDVSSGALTQQEAKQVREKIGAQADFYGAMDGASKFVRGDAIASLLMIFINLIGGMILGIGGKKLAIGECIELFVRLTIGEALVTQIPSLLISVGAGVIVTRASSESIGRVLPRQLFMNPKVLILGSGILFGLSLVPGMPFFLMASIASLIAFYGYRLMRKSSLSAISSTTSSIEVENPISFYPIEIHLGFQSLALANLLLQKIGEIRKILTEKWGIRIPAVHIADHLQLPPKGYRLKLRGIIVASGRVDSLDIFSNYLFEVLESHLYELINRQDVIRMMESAKLVDAALVEELIPERLKVGQVLRILQNLLKEGIPVRDFVGILELIADHLPRKGEIDLELLTEGVRQGLSRGISQHFFGEKKIAYAIMFDPKVEQTLQAAFQKEEFKNQMILRPATAQKIRASLMMLLEKAQEQGIRPVVLMHPCARRPLRHILEKELPHLPVLSFGEIDAEIEVRSLGAVTTEVLSG